MGYTNIPKPTDATYTKPNKAPIDLPLYGAAIYGTNKYGITNAYTTVNKPTNASYTNISKPT